MEMQEMNFQLVKVLREWDPFEVGPDNYDPEIADTLGAVHDISDPAALANKIRDIYEFSFERKIPLEHCKRIAQTLLSIKNQGSCSV